MNLTQWLQIIFGVFTRRLYVFIAMVMSFVLFLLSVLNPNYLNITASSLFALLIFIPLVLSLGKET